MSLNLFFIRINNIVKKYHSVYLTSIIPINNFMNFINNQGYSITNNIKTITEIENDSHNSITLSNCINNFILNNGK